jgi:hypothetical protein
LEQLPDELLAVGPGVAAVTAAADDVTEVSPHAAAAAADGLVGRVTWQLQPTAAGAAAALAEPAAAVACRERLLCRVLCGVLNASGVLPALLAVQQLDTVDVAGVEPLYRQLLQEQQQQQQREDKQSQQQAAQQQDVQQQAGEQQQQEVEQEQQQDDHLGLLRGYLTAATAKDCAVMITLQQVVQQQQAEVYQQQQEVQQQQQQQTQGAAVAPASSSTGGAPSAGGSPAVSSSNSNSGGGSSSSGTGGAAAHLYTDPITGCCFAWRMALVDLDLKPVSKVPVHAELDRAVVSTAQEAPQLLQQHLQDSGVWVEAACQWLAGP